MKFMKLETVICIGSSNRMSDWEAVQLIASGTLIGTGSGTFRLWQDKFSS